MFDQTLLDSLPSSMPVLRGRHWLISLGTGTLGFFAAFFGLPIVLVPPAVRVLVAQSVILGALLMFYALILCYVCADARHLGLSVKLWFAVTLLLNFVGFLIYLVHSAGKTANWKRATVPIAYIFEVILVGVAVLIPLIYTEALPRTQLMTFLLAPPAPPPAPPALVAGAPARVIKRLTAEDITRAPVVIPKNIARIVEEPEPPSRAIEAVGEVPGGLPGGRQDSILRSIIAGATPLAPPPLAPARGARPVRIHVGGQVEAARLIFQPRPEYPPLAKMARIQGTVRLEAIISKEGTIQDLRLLSGHPLLVKTAIEAVSRWRYQPTLLNGEPVEVATEIDVNFTLAE